MLEWRLKITFQGVSSKKTFPQSAIKGNSKSILLKDELVRSKPEFVCLPYSFLSSPVPWRLALRLKKSTGKSICVIDLPFFGVTSCSWGIGEGKLLAACLSRLLSLIDSWLFPQLTTLDDAMNNYQEQYSQSWMMVNNHDITSHVTSTFTFARARLCQRLPPSQRHSPSFAPSVWTRS